MIKNETHAPKHEQLSDSMVDNSVKMSHAHICFYVVGLGDLKVNINQIECEPRSGQPNLFYQTRILIGACELVLQLCEFAFTLALAFWYFYTISSYVESPWIDKSFQGWTEPKFWTAQHLKSYFFEQHLGLGNVLRTSSKLAICASFGQPCLVWISGSKVL